jgi:hypothetical protein
MRYLKIVMLFLTLTAITMFVIAVDTLSIVNFLLGILISVIGFTCVLLTLSKRDLVKLRRLGEKGYL